MEYVRLLGPFAVQFSCALKSQSSGFCAKMYYPEQYLESRGITAAVDGF